MKVVLLNQYYPPDFAPTGRYARDLARQLVSDGHEVTVYCSPGRGEMPTSEDGVKVCVCWATQVGRGWRKALHFATYMISAFFRLMVESPRPEVVVAMTTPPFLGALAHVVTRLRGGRHVDWIMDLYPEVIFAHGRVSRASLMGRGLDWMGWQLLERSDGIVAIAPDMAARVRRRLNHRRVDWVPLWMTSGEVQSATGNPEAYRRALGWDDKVVFLYSGNLGLGHRFREFFEVIRLSRGEPALWVFCGRGERLHEIEMFQQEHPEFPVEIMGPVEDASLMTHLLAADVHLISLDRGWEGCMVPSKLQGSMAVGRCLLGVVPGRSSVAAWIEESSGGVWVEPDDAEGLKSAVRRLLRDPEERMRRGEAGLRFAQVHFEGHANAKQVAEMVVKAPW